MQICHCIFLFAHLLAYLPYLLAHCLASPIWNGLYFKKLPDDHLFWFFQRDCSQLWLFVADFVWRNCVWLIAILAVRPRKPWWFIFMIYIFKFNTSVERVDCDCLGLAYVNRAIILRSRRRGSHVFSVFIVILLIIITNYAFLLIFLGLKHATCVQRVIWCHH